jgi:exodeoxyribonuclease-5
MMNPEQKIFFEAVTNLPKTGKFVIVLDAPGGTGKTFVLKLIAAARADIAVIAPTHKAVSLFHKEGIRRAQTIHRFLHAEKEIDEKTGDLYFVFNKDECEENVIIIDEASMVSADMLEKLYSLEKNLVFVGDRCQIPPVKEVSSPVFEIKNAVKYSFVTNMRVRNNPDSISAMYLAKFREGVGRPGSKIRVEKKSESFILDTFKDDDDVVVLAWTNHQVNNWNVKIRCHLFGQTPEELDLVYVNEKLIFSGFRRTYGTNYYSNDEVIVKKLKVVSLFVEYQTGDCTHQPPRLDNQKRRIVKCDECQIAGRSVAGHQVEFFEVTDQNDVLWLMPRKGIKQHKEIISDFKRHCIHIKSKPLWEKWYDFKKYYYPELNYSYAITVHKAQGSQWEFVNIDIDNIRFNRRQEERVRLEYTAVSRYSKMLFFV